MCLNPVKVYSAKHPNIANYFNCGHCSACLGQKAAYRGRLIRTHKPLDFDGSPLTCYFITLTYDNRYIPFVYKDELINAYKACFFDHKTSVVAIRRLFDPYVPSGCRHCDKPIDFIEFSSDKSYRCFSDKDFDKLTPLQSKVWLSSRNSKVVPFAETVLSDSDIPAPQPISVAYNKDWQNFIKRVREYISVRYGRVPLSYYYCPEYGPTTSRFHLHALVWLPKFLSEEQVKDIVCDNWKYADREFVEPYVQVAINAASYVSSYLNCSADVSKFLLYFFKLRASHSLGFGYTGDNYSPASIWSHYIKKRNTIFYEPRKQRNGTYLPSPVLLSTRLLYRYFPFLSSNYKISRDTLLDAFANPKKYFALTPCECGYTSDDKEYIYHSSIRDIYGHCVPFTVKQRDFFVNRLKRSYEFYFKPLGISYIDYVTVCVDINIRRSIDNLVFAYTLSDTPFFEVIYNFSDALEQEFYDIDDFDYFNRNLLSFNHTSFSSVIKSNSEYSQRYFSNIKHRKLNSFNSI